MRILVFTRKNMIVIFSTFSAAVLAVTLFLNGAFLFAIGGNKKLPIYKVGTEEKVVSLSLDAAWGNEQTENLLNTLQKFNVKTTFFLTGMWVEQYPESVKAIYNAGHDVGNHSETHPHMPKLDPEKMRDEITKCNEKIKNITGKSPELFRAPFGDYNNSLIDTIDDLKMYCIQWDIDSLDWKDRTSEQITRKIVSKLKPGSIILMHNGAKHTPEALPIVIEKIQEKGFKIIPISQIIYKTNYQITHDGTQIPKDN